MVMLKDLLQERFHLAAHRESVEMRILALVTDRDGSKLRPFGEKNSEPSDQREGRIVFLARHMPDLVERLAKVTGTPVVDKTGLNGDYLIELSYRPLGSAETDPPDPDGDIFSAVRIQLGLKLESQRGLVEVLKIGDLLRTPTEN
jgi:uncharacterized protein (TIGR03435 family)